MSALSVKNTRRSKSNQVVLSTFFLGSWMKAMRCASIPEVAALTRYPVDSTCSYGALRSAPTRCRRAFSCMSSSAALFTCARSAAVFVTWSARSAISSFFFRVVLAASSSPPSHFIRASATPSTSSVASTFGAKLLPPGDRGRDVVGALVNVGQRSLQLGDLRFEQLVRFHRQRRASPGSRASRGDTRGLLRMTRLVAIKTTPQRGPTFMRSPIRASGARRAVFLTRLRGPT